MSIKNCLARFCLAFCAIIVIFATLKKAKTTVMTTHPLWTDEYWLPLLKIYMARPEGVKPMYSRAVVDLALELHIPPQFIYKQMFRLRRPDSLWLTRLRDKYAANPKRLSRDVKKLHRMSGFSSDGGFYDGVEVSETFEKDFRPISGCGDLKPVMLVMALDLYFRLTPITMVADTPEVIQLARLMRIKPQQVVDVLTMFQTLDPYLHRPHPESSPLFDACRDVWHRYGNDDPEALSSLAAQLREYFS